MVEKMPPSPSRFVLTCIVSPFKNVNRVKTVLEKMTPIKSKASAEPALKSSSSKREITFYEITNSRRVRSRK